MMKLHYAKLPNGFGKENQYYLIDMFGNRYNIYRQYDNVTNEVFYKVSDPNRNLYCGYDLTAFYASSPLELIKVLNEIDENKISITEW